MKKQEKTTKQEIVTTQELIKPSKSKHCYKLTDEDKQAILLDYYLNRSKENISDICNRYSITPQTVYNVVKDKRYQKLLDEHITQCRKNFSKKTSIIIDKAIDQLNGKIEEGDANIKDLTTAIGILYDKNRLEQNLSTSNNEIKINIKIE